MMKSLLYKEFRLVAHPMLYITLAFGAMLLIPAYPFYVIFFYGCLGLFFCFINGRENKDAFFTATLPIQKRDVVKARCLFAVAAQLAQILLSIPFVVLRGAVGLGANDAGIEANPAFFGFVLIMFAIFNAVFFISFYKTAYKAGTAFLLAIIPLCIFVAAAESIIHVPALSGYLDTSAPEMMIRQIPVLLLGILVYAGGMLLTYRCAAKRFEAVDL